MVLDIIFIIFAGYGFYLGYSKGIIGTVFTVLAYTLGLVAGVKFAPSMTRFLEDLFSTNNPLMFFAGFLLSFVLIMVIIRMISKSLEGILKTANINVINKVLGGALLAGVMIVLHSILVWFADSAHLIDDQTKRTSITYPYVQTVPAQTYALAEKLKPTFQDFWNESLQMMDKLQNVDMERTESKPNVFDLPDEEENSEGNNENSN